MLKDFQLPKDALFQSSRSERSSNFCVGGWNLLQSHTLGRRQPKEGKASEAQSMAPKHWIIQVPQARSKGWNNKIGIIRLATSAREHIILSPKLSTQFQLQEPPKFLLHTPNWRADTFKWNYVNIFYLHVGQLDNGAVVSLLLPRCCYSLLPCIMKQRWKGVEGGNEGIEACLCQRGIWRQKHTLSASIVARFTLIYFLMRRSSRLPASTCTPLLESCQFNATLLGKIFNATLLGRFSMHVVDSVRL